MAGRKKSGPYTYERAWNYVLWLLGRQSYTKAQLAKKLERKEATPEIIERVLEKLERLHFVDDALYAENYIRARKRKKGPLALKQELYQKGVPGKLIAPAIEELGEEEQVQAALTLVEKQAWRWKGEPFERRSKAYAYLARRGYPGDVVKRVLEVSEELGIEE